MREHPIIFSAPMVRAILEGRKTQTRRVVKPQPADDIHLAKFPNPTFIGWKSSLRHSHGNETSHTCPYGVPGDRLWVRESHRLVDFEITGDRASCAIEYLADGARGERIFDHTETLMSEHCNVRPSIHLPRALSRITLEITGVRVERVQDISEADACAEGISYAEAMEMGDSYAAGFRQLWHTIHAAEGPNGWDANPWLWVIEFKAVRNG